MRRASVYKTSRTTAAPTTTSAAITLYILIIIIHTIILYITGLPPIYCIQDRRPATATRRSIFLRLPAAYGDTSPELLLFSAALCFFLATWSSGR